MILAPTARGFAKRWLGPDRVGTGSLVDRLVAARGIAAEDRAQFLSPSLTDRERPWERPEYVAAADAILEAAAARRSIVIYGDYDVDGITSMAILWHALRAVAPEAPLRTYV